MDHELWLQQCRIHQNKDKEPISLSYADADHFYKTLDKYVFDGYKIKISFVLEKLSTGSFLLERIISCLNGKSLIDDYQDIYDNLHDILDFNNQEHFIGAIMQCIDTDNKIYHSYLFKYNACCFCSV